MEAHWNEAANGIYRPGYSQQENEAIEAIAVQARILGMEETCDAAGNAYFTYPGQDRTKPVVMIGSHVDAVPSGGRYDGTAGVVAGIAALKKLHEDSIVPPQDVCVAVFRGEESAWYGMSCMGSKFVTGALSAEFLKTAKHKESGATLAHHMQQCGIDTAVLTEKLSKGEPVFPLERIGRYIEAHIEQGPALLEAQKSLGIVTAIRGHVRYPNGIVFKGEAAHSGSTPQHMRKDAAIAAAAFVSRWAEAMSGYAGSGPDIVFSVPGIHVIDPSSTTIPAACFVQPEVRSTVDHVLSDTASLTLTIARGVARDMNLAPPVFSDPVMGQPAVMDGNLQDVLQDTADRLGFSSMAMPSGAGHDAGILAHAGVPCGMIFIRHGRAGISHNSGEIMALTDGDDPFSVDGDFCKAVQVLVEIMAQGVDSSVRNRDKPGISASP